MNIILKKIIKKEKGFTLVELLLVLAIVGILAGVIMMGMGGARKRARATAAMKTAKSVKAEMADCYLRGKTITSPRVGATICTGAGNYPALPQHCSYTSYASNILTVTCPNRTITCGIVEGGCTVAVN